MFFDKKKKLSLDSDKDFDIAVQSILAEGITVKDGNLYGSNNIKISGVFFGDVDIEGILVITESGNLKGEVKADDVYIYGTIEGRISVKGRVHIYSGSRVIGDIFSESLIIEEGAVFKGQCSTGTTQASNIFNIAGTISTQQEIVNNKLLVNTKPNKEYW